MKPPFPAIAAIVMFAAVALAWSDSFDAPFQFDDIPSVVENPTIRSLGSTNWLFPPSTAGETVSGRPVLNFTFAINHAIGGLDVTGYRLLNILIHGIAALLMFGIVRRTLRSFGASRSDAGDGIAFSVAILWAVHPLTTAAVTPVVQRAESLCGMLMLLSLYCFVRGAAGGAVRPRAWATAAVVAGLLAAGTKEVAVALPVIVLLYDRTFLAGSFLAAFRKRWRTHAALASTWLLIAALVLSNRGRGGSAGFGAAIDSWTYLLTQADALVRYLGLAVWPHPLVFDYGVPVAEDLGSVALQFCVVVLLLGATVVALVKRPALGFVGAWFFAILAPSSSVVPVATQTIAEHRMYLPLAAVILLAVLAGELALIRLRVSRLALVIVPLVVLALGTTTFVRNQAYASELSLWQDTVAKVPANPRAQHNLGLALAAEGRADEAIASFERAIQLQPDHAFARFSLATLLLGQGHRAEAEIQYRAAIAADPAHTAARVNLAALLLDSGRAAEALPHLREAIAASPDLAEAHYQLARAIEATGGAARAAEESYGAAVRLNPRMAPAHLALGNLLAMRGDVSGAERSVREAVRLDANLAGARFALGNLLAGQQRFDAAITEYREALRIDPRHADALNNLGNCQLVTGRYREAAATYTEVLRLRPDDESVRENLRIARELERSGARR